MKIIKTKYLRNFLSPFLALTFILSALSCGNEDDNSSNPDTPSIGENQYLLFSSDRDGDWDIYGMKLNSFISQKITENGVKDLEGSLSPSGAKIIYKSNYLNGETESRRIDNEDGSVTFENFEIYGDDDLFIMNVDGSDSKLFFENQKRSSDPIDVEVNGQETLGLRVAIDELDIEGSPEWSPDGSKIAFHKDTQGNGVFEIYTVDADGQNIKQITNLGGISWGPSWSPDGTKLVFYTFSPDSQKWFLKVVDLADSLGGSFKITEIKTGMEGATPQWSPIDDRIIFASRKNGFWGIFLTDLSDSETSQLTPDGSNSLEPIWSPDGKQIAFADDRMGLNQIFFLDLETDKFANSGQLGIPNDWIELPQS
tara:strand:+ start:1835 stop:2938 length:1104 start_codon:yes stop_codon:yes gene_type:complete